MNFIEKLIYFLQGEMSTPKPFGWFHLLCISFVVIFLIILYKKGSKNNLKLVLGIYGITALILELLKQVIWTFNYDSVTGLVTWDYQWYAFPFQLCTTPIFVSIICLFLKENKLRNSLLSYMAFTTILGSITTMLLPESCFTSDILVNIHTMWLHLGSFIVSIYLLMSGIVQINKENLKNAIKVFLVFVFIAESLNIIVYHSGILAGETFDMFYISPYFETVLPVFSLVEAHVPFIIYLILYIISLIIGSSIIYFISKKISVMFNKKQD